MNKHVFERLSKIGLDDRNVANARFWKVYLDDRKAGYSLYYLYDWITTCDDLHLTLRITSSGEPSHEFEKIYYTDFPEAEEMRKSLSDEMADNTLFDNIFDITAGVKFRVVKKPIDMRAGARIHEYLVEITNYMQYVRD